MSDNYEKLAVAKVILDSLAIRNTAGLSIEDRAKLDKEYDEARKEYMKLWVKVYLPPVA